MNILRTNNNQVTMAPFIVFAPYNPICIKLDSNHKKKSYIN
jgi:hypothetical protein